MDMSKFTEIGGREAANRLLDDLDIYSEGGNRYYMQHGKVWMESGGLSGLVMLTLAETFSRKWYVKKPFNVRAEMLARPDEWVGAYKDGDLKWHKVAFDFKEMRAVETPFSSVVEVDYGSPNTAHAYSEEFERCIPIEEVPQEEWK